MMRTRSVRGGISFVRGVWRMRRRRNENRNGRARERARRRRVTGVAKEGRVIVGSGSGHWAGERGGVRVVCGGEEVWRAEKRWMACQRWPDICLDRFAWNWV